MPIRIVFQGDSITDAGRDRGNDRSLGIGYAMYSAKYIREMFPKESFEFINRGINGHRTCDLLERWQQDCIDLNPDILSLMIGINDAAHHFGTDAHMSTENFAENLRRLLSDVREHTHAKILLMEPYLLPGNPETAPWRPDLDTKIQAVRAAAREFADVYLPVDGLLAAACVGEEPSHWSADTVHLNEEGSKLIAEYYANLAAELIESL